MRVEFLNCFGVSDSMTYSDKFFDSHIFVGSTYAYAWPKVHLMEIDDVVEDACLVLIAYLEDAYFYSNYKKAFQEIRCYWLKENSFL